LINSTNAIECDFLTANQYGIDAALWIGYTGSYGLNAIADIIAGEVNPSGRLVDTYCNDNTTAPAMVGFYTSTYAGSTDGTNEDFYKISSLDGNSSYTIYQEGIYVGYRYYETRYEDVIMGTGNTASYNYAADVAYPFGYGLSYTDFEWSDFDVSFNKSEDQFEVSVKVTNTGDVAGKEVVQVYFQSPYTEYDIANGIEKAAVELCGFGKTQILQPGASETVTITVAREEFAAYDRNGAKTYILDAGDYYLTAAKHAHDAVNNVLAAKGYSESDGMDAAGNVDFTYHYENDELDVETYSVSSATGAEITNQLSDADLNYYGYDLTYLSRTDWQETWPVAIENLEANEQMMEGLTMYQTYAGEESEGVEMPTMDADNGLTLAMFIGVDYDDPMWEDLLDQLTFDEMATLIGKGFHNTAVMESVGKPATLDDNGPQGFTQSLSGVSTCHTAYSDENIMAATYNVELMYEVGRSLGNDMLDLGASGLYGPAMNIHRTAYAGRNFEYYSEDGFLSGRIAAAEVAGIQSKGIYVYIKHFAFNDSETDCRCISTYFNEQAARELYLKPFEMAVVEGNAMNVMNSFARVGTIWSGAHKGLMTNILRDEWGMEGFALTDFSGNSALASYGMFLKSFDVAYGLLAGTDSWDSSADQWTDDLMKLYKDDPAIVQAMRQASHRVLYTVANSHAMNGISASTVIKSVTPWWKPTLIGLDVVIGLAFLGCLYMAIRKRKNNA
jgi:beta-glucosidase